VLIDKISKASHVKDTTNAPRDNQPMVLVFIAFAPLP
jgi:hypothetical protein